MKFKTMLPLIWNWMGSASEYLLFTYLIYIDCAAVLLCAAICKMNNRLKAFVFAAAAHWLLCAMAIVARSRKRK
jgi:hypothetical protein